MQALADDIQQEQDAIDDALISLEDQGATDDQIMAWRFQNQAILNAQTDRAALLSAYFTLSPMDYISDIEIPANASATAENFLVLNATLYNRFAEIHNELVQQNGGAISAANASAVEEAANDTFQEENAADLTTKSALSSQIADECDRQRMDTPVLIIPANASSI